MISDSPLGMYVPADKPFTPENWMSLDATLFEEDNKLYTIFSHEWTQIYDGEIVLAELDTTNFSDLLTLTINSGISLKV